MRRHKLSARMLALIDVQKPYLPAFQRWAAAHGHEAVSLPAEELALVSPASLTLCVLQAETDAAVRRDRIRKLLKAGRACPWVVLAGSLSIDAVVALIREGAADVIGLPADPEDAVARAVLYARRHDSLGHESELIGQTLAIERVREEIADVAPSQSTVLITGETGSGKGIVARLLHAESRRRGRPFVHVDCAALASSVVESEFFGHERGSFTGAVSRRSGRFELAGRGTIFLDEIGELSPDLQAKLLGVLQDRTFERIGGSETLPMEARVLAATNRDLRAEVRAGRFRSDLFFRLNVFEIHIPPLRRRLDDLPLLVRAAMDELAAQLVAPVPPISSSFYEMLARHDWPGNVRELFNVLERLLVAARDSVLDASSLERIGFPVGRIVHDGGEQPAAPTMVDREDLREDRRRIAEVLAATGGNVARAARRLGIARSTLRYRIRRCGLGEAIPHD